MELEIVATGIKMKNFPMIDKVINNDLTYTLKNCKTFFKAGDDIQADFCVELKDDSMSDSQALKGDHVFIKRQPVIESGKVAAVLVNDDILIRRVFINRNILTLTSGNESVNYDRSKDLNIYILGKAVVVVKSLDL